MTVSASERHRILVEAAAAAREKAASLRARARAGDATVTARMIPEADAAIELADIRVQGAEDAAAAEQAAERVRVIHDLADGYLAEEPRLRSEFVEALAQLETALEVVLSTGRVYNAHNAEMRSAARRHAGAGTDRVAFAAIRGNTLHVDGVHVRDVPVAEWVKHLCDAAYKKAGPDERRALWPGGPASTDANSANPEDPYLAWKNRRFTGEELQREEMELAQRQQAENEARRTQTVGPALRPNHGGPAITPAMAATIVQEKPE